MALLRTFLGIAGLALAATGQVPVEPPPADIELYALHCSPCHGARGRGDGVAGRFLAPSPRNLRAEPLRFVSGARGRARDADLARTLREGLKGTSMLSFRHLGEERIDRLVGVLRWFQRLGLEEQREDLAENREALRAWVRDGIEPGKQLAVPAAPANTALGRARGRLLYSAACASCHGQHGRGDGPQEVKDSAGRVLRPRDLTRGILKGGHAPDELFRRIRLGLPGSSMPALTRAMASDAEVWDLVRYVETLIPSRAHSLHDTTRRTVRVPFAEGPVATDPADPRFDRAARLFVPLAPFRDVEASVEGIVVDLFHDGELIQLRARWSDPTRNIPSATHPFPPDGLAARVTNFVNPPVLPIPGLPLPLDRALWLAGDMPEAENPIFDASHPRFDNPDGVCKSPIGPERVGQGEWVSGVWTLVMAVRPDRGGEIKRGEWLFMSWSVFDGSWKRGPMPIAFSNWNRLEFQ